MDSQTDAKPAASLAQEKRPVSRKEEKLARALKSNLVRRKEAAARATSTRTPENG